MRPLAYGCSGGDLIAGAGTPITVADARALWGLYGDELHAARRAGESYAAARASRLARQLLRAVQAQVRWRKASRRVA